MLILNLYRLTQILEYRGKFPIDLSQTDFHPMLCLKALWFMERSRSIFSCLKYLFWPLILVDLWYREFWNKSCFNSLPLLSLILNLWFYLCDHSIMILFLDSKNHFISPQISDFLHGLMSVNDLLPPLFLSFSFFPFTPLYEATFSAISNFSWFPLLCQLILCPVNATLSTVLVSEEQMQVYM